MGLHSDNGRDNGQRTAKWCCKHLDRYEPVEKVWREAPRMSVGVSNYEESPVYEHHRFLHLGRLHTRTHWAPYKIECQL